MGIMSLMGGFFNEITNRAVGVRWGGGLLENCQNPLNALVEEIQQLKKFSWGVEFLNPLLSIML